MNRFLIALLLMSASLAHAASSEDVFFSNGNVRLRGRIFQPTTTHTTTTEFPAIVITHGSGRQGIESSADNDLATKLADLGFIVMLYDKRGVGKSDGYYRETPEMHVAAGDLVAAVQFVKTIAVVDRSRVGVYGHSQGGWVAPLASVISEDIRFLMVSCGGGVSVQEQVLYGYRGMLEKDFRPAEVDSTLQFADELFKYLGTGKNYVKVREEFGLLQKRPWFNFFSNMGLKNLPPPHLLSDSSYIFFKNIQYTPLPTLSFLKIPTLVMLAENDNRIPSTVVKDIWQSSFSLYKRSHLLDIAWLEKESHANQTVTAGISSFKKTFFDPMEAWLRKNILDPGKKK